MWQYLEVCEASLAISSLIEDHSWGDFKSYKQVVELCERSVTLAHVTQGQVVALANIYPIHENNSAWLMVWLTPKWRRSKRSYYHQQLLWQALQKITLEKMQIKLLLAIARKKSVAKLAQRFGSSEVLTLPQLYGTNHNGYLVYWEAK